jgi:alpha-1,3-mannosyltransferase
MSTRELQGVNFMLLGADEAIRHLEAACGRPGPTKVAIANAHTLNLARRQAPFRKVLTGFLVLNDGIGVDIASRLRYGQRFPANLNGTDLVPALLQQASRPLRVFLLGAKPAAVAQAFQNVQQRFPRHAWVGHADGYGRPEDEAALCARIRELQVDVLLVAMGNPVQEFWIERCAEATGARVCIGVGALFDFWAGTARRAPAWVRRLKLEWVYRLLREPGRLWQRYLIGNVSFLWAALLERRSHA